MPYQPEALPIGNLNVEAIIGAAGMANASLGRYDGLLQSLLNPDVLLAPMVEREAVLSSKIEGTQATVEEVLGHEAGVALGDESKIQDIREVMNYRLALRQGSRERQDRPIRLNLILQLHATLMESVRGHNKAPGQFRRDQNWIGPVGSTVETATFVPPSPLQLDDHLRALEAYLATEDRDPLIQCAIMHGQFELLHPFIDGNGRIGRVLIPLFLYKKQKLSSPMFYLSAYLERHRDEYCNRLQAISESSDWTGWVKFFLEAIHQQAVENCSRVKRIRDLHTATSRRVRELTRSQYSQPLTDAMFKRPVFQVSGIAQSASIPLQTASNMIRQLVEATSPPLRLLQQGAGRRPSVYYFGQLLRIASEEVDNEQSSESVTTVADGETRD